MNIDEAIKLLESEGFEVHKKRKIVYDGSFLGIKMTGERLDSSANNTVPKNKLEQLRLDALNARNEMITRLSPNTTNPNENHSQKSTQALRDIAKAHQDAANDRLQGYLA